MIAFGCSITKPDQFRRCAEPGIRRAAGARTRMRYVLPLDRLDLRELQRASLDRAAERDDLEALVLVHQDAEIVDADLCAKVRAALRDPERRRSSAASARSTCAASPGGRARSRSPRSSTATRSTAAATCASFSWTWDDAPP